MDVGREGSPSRRCAAPPQEGFKALCPPLRIPPMGVTGTAWSASIFGIEREKKLRTAATSVLTFTTFSQKFSEMRRDMFRWAAATYFVSC
jgi:hypothetical protein